MSVDRGQKKKLSIKMGSLVPRALYTVTASPALNQYVLKLHLVLVSLDILRLFTTYTEISHTYSYCTFDW